MENFKLIQEIIESHSRKLTCATISPKSKRFIATGGGDGNILLWALGQTKPIQILSGHSSTVRSVCFHNSESYVAGGSQDGTLKIWDLKQGGKVARSLTDDTHYRGGCIKMVFHPSKEILITSTLQNIVQVWDFRNRKCIRRFNSNYCDESEIKISNINNTSEGNNTFSYSDDWSPDEMAKMSLDFQIPILQFSPNGKWLFFSRSSSFPHDKQTENSKFISLSIWDLTSDSIRTLKHPKSEGMITSIDFHPLELLLTSVTSAGVVRIWQLEKKFRLLSSYSIRLPLVRSPLSSPKVFFSENGNSLFCLAFGKLVVFQCTSPSEIEDDEENEDQNQDLLEKELEIETGWFGTIESITLFRSTAMVVERRMNSNLLLWVGDLQKVIEDSKVNLPPVIQASLVVKEEKSTPVVQHLPTLGQFKLISAERDLSMTPLDINSFFRIDDSLNSMSPSLLIDEFAQSHKSLCKQLTSRLSQPKKRRTIK